VRKEFAVFVLLGVGNTVLTLVLYWVLLRWMSHTFAYAISYASGIVFSAVTNARLTFRSTLTGTRFAAFALWWLGLYAVNAALLEALVRWAGMDPRYAVLVVTALAVPIGFFGSRLTLKR
jgi:putative flippase GtrA